MVAALLAGALVGALGGGAMSDALGRKKTLLGVAVVFLLGALLSAVAPNVTMLVVARVALGLSIGVSSVCVPLYIAEVAPKERRGRLVSMNQFLITLGILLSYLVNYAFEPIQGWRWMLAAAAVPALAMLVGLIGADESPRWLVLRGRTDEAERILRGVTDCRPRPRRDRRDRLHRPRGEPLELVGPAPPPAATGTRARHRRRRGEPAGRRERRHLLRADDPAGRLRQCGRRHPRHGRHRRGQRARDRPGAHPDRLLGPAAAAARRAGGGDRRPRRARGAVPAAGPTRVPRDPRRGGPVRLHRRLRREPRHRDLAGELGGLPHGGAREGRRAGRGDALVR